MTYATTKTALLNSYFISLWILIVSESTQLSCEFLYGTKSYRKNCRNADQSDNDHGSWRRQSCSLPASSTLKLYKKAKPNPSDTVQVNHKFEIDIHITFTHAGHSGRKFNVATHAKKLFLAMLHHDESITIKTACDMLSVATNAFPNHKEQFCKFFHIHKPTNHSQQCNQTVIGGTILCNHTIQELKKVTTNQHDMMQWLQNNHIYIEADSLGTTKICTVGYLFNIHPSISFHLNIKKHLYNELEKVSIMMEEAQALNMYAKQYHDETFNKTFIPPFEIYVTSAGHGTGKNGQRQKP